MQGQASLTESHNHENVPEVGEGLVNQAVLLRTYGI